jgi:hypothetical protein
MQIHLNAYQISFYLNAHGSQTHSDKEVMSFLVIEFYRTVNNLKVQFCWTCTLSLILSIHSPSLSPLFISTLSTLFLSTLSLIILNIVPFLRWYDLSAPAQTHENSQILAHPNIAKFFHRRVCADPCGQSLSSAAPSFPVPIWHLVHTWLWHVFFI